MRAFGDEDSQEGGCSDRERMRSGINWHDDQSVDFTQDTQGLESNYIVSSLFLQVFCGSYICSCSLVAIVIHCTVYARIEFVSFTSGSSTLH